jgi:signal transduction histidine kinase/CheY-like chemotaxis protein
MGWKKTLFNEMKRFEYQITFSYLLIGFLWIFLSDTLFGHLITDKNLLTEFSIAKGFFYMITTALLLFFFVKRQMTRLKNAKEKAEESNRLKSAFLANMSHEIRTPMNGILGFAELLREPCLTSEEQEEYVKIIEKSGKRMLNIINDIIDISKIESGQMSLDIKKVNVNEQMETIYQFFLPEAENKGLELFCDKRLFDDTLCINTDYDKFYSILSNLIKNAIKYSNEGFVEFGCAKKGAYLEVFVKDTGIGIPKERQNAVFERFVQADISDKMARQGAGLGLSISKAYVEMLGGNIWLESEEGQGTTFYFSIPFKPETILDNIAGENAFEQEEEYLVRKLKILIAEDDEVSQRLIEKGVNVFSREILKAWNGAEAVEICRNNPDIDLIMMDIQMPVMDGLEATKLIREFNEKVIIIAQTAYALSGDREIAMEVGSNDYISKPIMKIRLHELIRKHFN